MPPWTGSSALKPLYHEVDPRLVVDDDEPAVAGAVDAVGRAAEPQRPPVGQLDREAVEPELGRERWCARARPRVVGVGVEERVELGEDPAPVAVPEQPPDPRASVARFGGRDLGVGDFVQPGHGRPTRTASPSRTRRASRARASPRSSGDSCIDLLGPLDRLDVQHVVHEVRVRALRPRLQPRRRDHGRRGRRPARGDAVAQGREVAVEARERGRAAREHQLAPRAGRAGTAGRGRPRARRARRARVASPGTAIARARRRTTARACTTGLDRRSSRRAAERLDGVEQEPRRHVLGAAAQVAAREEEHARAGGRRERREQRAVVVVDALAPGARSSPSSAARSASASSESSRATPGNTPSASPHTNTRSSSTPSASADRADEHAFAEPADALARSFELELERAAEHVERGRGLDRVETRRAGRARPRRAARLPARTRATRRAAASSPRYRRTRPCAQPRLARPRLRDARVVEIAREAADELERAVRSARARVGSSARARSPAYCVEPRLPLRHPADHTGLARDALPARRRRTLARARRAPARPRARRTRRRGGSRRRAARAGAAARGRARSRQRAHRHAVVRDAGQRQVLVQQPRVRLRSRVQHRHPFERHAVAHRVDHMPDDGAHFVVGIGHGDDRGAGRARDREQFLVVDLDAEPAHGRDDGRIRAGVAGEADDDRARSPLRERPQKAGRGQSEVLRQVADDRAEVGVGVSPRTTRSAAVCMRSCSSYQSVASRSRAARWIRTTSRALGLCAASVSSAASSRSASSRCAATSASSVAGCATTGAKRPGSSSRTRRTAAATTGVDTGRRRGGGERGRGEQLGEAEHGEERDADEPLPTGRHRPESARREQAPGRDADGVRRHDDRDGRERLPGLGRDDLARAGRSPPPARTPSSPPSAPSPDRPLPDRHYRSPTTGSYGPGETPTVAQFTCRSRPSQ